MPLACKANALPYELHPHTNKNKKVIEYPDESTKKEKKNFSKNSPTGIRTPGFHVTGEDSEPTILLEITE